MENIILKTNIYLIILKYLYLHLEKSLNQGNHARKQGKKTYNAR